jgi:APA family basic amino acid/polyamine antiporter
MIGTGVFTTTGFLVRDVSSLSAVVLAWAIGGLVALCGALSYGELTAAIPVSGGEYSLLARIYHPALGFLAGWASFVVGFSAPTAASALAFAHYVGAIVPGAPRVPIALALLATLSILHALNVRTSIGFQNAFTVGKIVLVAGFATIGLAFAEPSRIAAPANASLLDAALSSTFAVGLIYISFSYSGWNAAAYIAGEVRRPERSLPLALAAGTLTVAALYMALNVAFVSSAPRDALSGQVEVAHVAAVALFGDSAANAVSGLIALGLVSTVGALIVAGPRVYEQMGRDLPALGVLALRREGAGPAAAIAAQAVAAAVMIVSASFDALLAYIGVTLSLFTALTVVGVFVLRWREPTLSRPYRVLGYPVTPALFVALEAWVIAHTVVERPRSSLAAAVTLGAGALLYLWARRGR